jgi:hypothetical protein
MATHFFVNEAQVKRAVDKHIRKLGKDVVRVFYTVKEDSGGDPSIFFRVVMTDAAMKRSDAFDATQRVREELFYGLRPHEKWGLYPYFNFRAASEYAKGKDPNWM